jgi:hypothetical protein
MMANRDLFDSLKQIKDDANTGFDAALLSEKSILDLVGNFINSDEVSAKYGDETKEYDDFDDALMKFIEDIVNVVESSKMMHSQKDFLNNYMSILKKLKKDS